MAKFRADKSSKENKNSGAELYCPEEALSDNDDSDQGPISNKHISSQGKYIYCVLNRVVNHDVIILIFTLYFLYEQKKSEREKLRIIL